MIRSKLVTGLTSSKPFSKSSICSGTLGSPVGSVPKLVLGHAILAEVSRPLMNLSVGDGNQCAEPPRFTAS